MKKTDGIFIDKIKEKVEEKIGHTIHYSKDCQNLSISIFNETNRQISTSTLKRFWGLINSKFNPAGFTLDTLAVFCGYHSWVGFTQEIENNQTGNAESTKWFSLLKKYRSVTVQAVNSIKTRIRINSEKSIMRSFAVNKLKSFLKSKTSATAFIAPGGYGKTSLIIKLIEDYFLKTGGRYEDDIILLFDCASFELPINQEFNINNFISSLLSLDVEDNIRRYFFNNPEKRDGNFVFFIYGLHEISGQKDIFEKFINSLIHIIQTNNETPWFKIILSCRPEEWKYISQQITLHPTIIKQWYKVNITEDYFDTINVPFLDKIEIDEIFEIQNSPTRYDDVIFKNPELQEIISLPYFLNLYLQQEMQEKIVNEIDIFNSYIRKVLFTGVHIEGKSQIINTFLRITNLGLYGDSITKNEIQDAIKEYLAAYNELLSYGILYEYKIEDEFFSIETYIRFSHQLLFEFLIVNLLLREFSLNKELIIRIGKFYSSNSTLKHSLTKWLIKYAFYNNKKEIIEDIYKIIIHNILESNTRQTSDYSLADYIKIIGTELRQNKAIQTDILKSFAQSAYGRRLYFEWFPDIDYLCLHFSEGIEYYMDNCSTETCDIYAKAILLIKSVFQENNIKSYQYYTSIDNYNNYSFKHLTKHAFYFYALLAYQYFIIGNVDKNLLKHIVETTKALYSTMKKYHQSIVYFLFSIFDVFDLCNLHNENIKLMEFLIDDTAKYDQIKNAGIFPFLELFYMNAIICEGKQTEILDRFEDLSLQSYPVNMRYYITARVSMIKMNYFIYNQKLELVPEYIERVIHLADLLHSRLFRSIALKIKWEIVDY